MLLELEPEEPGAAASVVDEPGAPPAMPAGPPPCPPPMLAFVGPGGAEAGAGAEAASGADDTPVVASALGDDQMI